MTRECDERTNRSNEKKILRYILREITHAFADIYTYVSSDVVKDYVGEHRFMRAGFAEDPLASDQ